MHTSKNTLLRQRNGTTKIVLKSIFFAFLIVLLLMFSFYIIMPSIASTMSSCTHVNNVTILGLKYIKVGELNVTLNPVTNKTNTTINVFETTNIDSTYKHEYCHLAQFKEKRLFNCNYGGSFRFVNEIECSMSEYYPNWMYKGLY